MKTDLQGRCEMLVRDTNKMIYYEKQDSVFKGGMMQYFF